MKKNNDYVLVKKAYWVGHKDEIGKSEQCPPEQISCNVIHVNANEGEAKARHEFYSLECSYGEPLKYIDVRAKRRKGDDKYFFDGRELYLHNIFEIKQRENWRKDMEKFVADNPKAKVHIWSGEYSRFWRSNGMGYTDEITQAGIYKIKDALSRVYHCDIHKKISLQLIK